VVSILARSIHCGKDVNIHVDRARESGLRIPKFLGHSKDKPLKADGAAAVKVLTLLRYLCQKENREIRAVLFIRDLDNQSARREGLEQARLEQADRQPNIEIVIGTANRMREVWVLNGFIPVNSEETRILGEIVSELRFDPCEEAHRLRSNSWDEPDRRRNPKVVLERLTHRDTERERQCWEKTPLDHLRRQGSHTGLSAYLEEIEQRLVPLVSS
jgi:hypothetical protein